MNQEDFRKFDKETWLRFVERTVGLDENLFNCLTRLERCVQIDKLMAQSELNRQQSNAILTDETKISEWLYLLRKGMRIHKKLTKLFDTEI